MKSAKIVTIATTQDQPAYCWFHTKQSHAAGNGSVTVHVAFPKTAAHSGGFPVQYHPSVMPDQPCVVSITNKTQEGFDVMLSSLTGKALAAGSFSVMCIG